MLCMLLSIRMQQDLKLEDWTWFLEVELANRYSGLGLHHCHDASQLRTFILKKIL